MTPKRRGILFVVSAPSGCGKSTLTGMLLNDFPNLTFSISCTTREPREGEKHGVHYSFISKEEFLDRRNQNYFAEWAEVYGNFYGTPAQAAEDLRSQGRDVLFDVDVQGAAQIKERLPDACLVFIMPPSMQTLRDRLHNRGSDSDEAVRKRLSEAPAEIRRADMFEYWVVNDDLQTAYADLKSIYSAQCLRSELQPALISSVLGDDNEETDDRS